MGRIVFAVGGTGGHLLPAMHLYKRCFEKDPELQGLFMGVGLRKNAILSKEIPFKQISGATIGGRNPFKILIGLMKILKGFFESTRFLIFDRPDMIIGFGSFHSFPILAAAWLLRIPYLLYEPNALPGKVNRIFAKRALATAVPFKSAKALLKGNIKEVAFFSGHPFKMRSKTEARRAFSLKEDLFTLLVFGGSQGARYINEVFLEMLQAEKKIKSMQVIHLAGKSQDLEALRRFYGSKEIPCHVVDFEKNMSLAWSAADFALCRAGALTIAEQMLYEVPALFIPYPSSKDNHQLFNAQYVATVVKGGIMLPQKSCSAAKLFELLSAVWEEGEAIKKMQNAIHVYKKNHFQEELPDLLLKILDR